MSDELPEEIKRLVARCEVGECSFDNDDMSAALHFGETLWRRLMCLAEHYERQSGNFMSHDIRGPMMAHAAKDMRYVLDDTRLDIDTQ